MSNFHLTAFWLGLFGWLITLALVSHDGIELKWTCGNDNGTTTYYEDGSFNCNL